MQYRSQKLAYPYLAAALVFFGLQVVFGLLTAAKYVWDFDPLLKILPFNMSRAIHLNLLVVWLLMGFMGGAYYLIPEETGRELWSPVLAKIQFVFFASLSGAAVAGYLGGWFWGMPFLEQPTVIKFGIVLVALAFLLNIVMTIVKARKVTVISGMLVGGLALLAVFFLFGIFFMKNLTTQYYWWWWVIHLWVEGAWELVAGSIIAFVLLKLTGVRRSLVEKWLYIEAGLVLFTGIAGTGHHYYWIGTPRYWLWVGGIFSALEPLPILFMVIDTLREVRERAIEIGNSLVLRYAVAGAFLHFVGAGVWGFAQTLPMINKWTHGTQITASHGHFAFFGAYAMINLTVMAFVLPALKKAEMKRDRLGMPAFSLMVFFLLMIVVSLAIAGIVQVYFQRVMGLDYLTTQGYLKLWYGVFFASACCFAVGVFLAIGDFLTLGRLRPPAAAGPEAPE